MTPVVDRPWAWPDGETGLIAAIAVLVVIAALLLVAAGAVAALLFGRGWAWPPTEAWGKIIHTALAHPKSPALGWPADLAGRLPGASAYWATYAALAAGSVSLGWLAWTRLGGRRVGPGPDGLARPGQLRHEASAGAARRRRAITRPGLAGRHRLGPAEFGYPLGRSLHGGVALWASWESSARVIGPPGEGKTFRVLARVLRHHPGPVVATSTKADLYELTADARARRGPVAVLDPERIVAGAVGVRWSPVAGCENSVIAERRAAALLAAAGDTGDSRYGAFFTDAARDLLKCYLHAAALSGGDIRTVLGWSRRLDDPTPSEILRTEPAAAPGWAGIISVHTTGAIETTSGVMRHLARGLACFSHPHVIEACCPEPGDEFDIGSFLDAEGTVYLLGKGSGMGAVAPLLTAFAQELFDVAERQANRQTTRRLDPPLLGLLDEAPSIAPIPGLPGLLADGRGRGIVVVYGMQSFSQAVTRWGTSEAETMANATNITVVFGGLTSAKDLADLERVCGTRQARRDSIHRGAERNSRSATRSWEHQPVLRSGDIRTLPSGTALVLWGRLPPILARQPMLTEDRDWKTIQAAQPRPITTPESEGETAPGDGDVPEPSILPDRPERTPVLVDWAEERWL